MPATPSNTVVNFTQYTLEDHVQKALQKAWVLSGGQPLNAKHLLSSAILVARTKRSKAFEKIASLLGQAKVSDATSTDVSAADLAALPLTKALADSVSVAEGFLKEAKAKAVWGRDYVTLALLAREDTSLDEIVREGGSDVEAVRDAWYEFVTHSSSHRTPEAWQRWWRSAGVALPTKEPAASREAYLFTWNPKDFPFPDLEHKVEEIQRSGSCVFRWSTGNRRDVAKGARVYLLRQVVEPRGLVAAGEVLSDVMEGPHWDEGKRKEGERSLVVEVRWTALSREPFLDLPQLVQATGEATAWSTRASGVRLVGEVFKRLEEAWPRAWAKHKALPDMEPKEWIPRFDADRGTAQGDSLKLDGYVHAFARVMASRSLTPPMSIGLFGDWGSGKSFFMERLYETINELSSAEGAAPLYWQKICQIRFNAWHYTETNLWASMVSTIFGELRSFLDGDKEEPDEFNRLLKELEVAGELLKDANKKVDDAKIEHEKAKNKVAEAEKKLQDLPIPQQPSDKRVREILEKNLTEVVKGMTVDEVAESLESAATWTGREEFKKGAEDLRSGKTKVEETAALFEEAQALSSRAGFWWRVLSAAKLYKTRGFWIVIAVMVAIAVIFVILQLAPKKPPDWASTWALLSEILTAAGAIIAWVRSRLAGASGVFDRLSSIQGRIARSIEEARNEDRQTFEKERDDAIRAEKKALAELEQSRIKEQEAAEKVRQAEEAKNDATSQARLGRFIRERASSADYEKHLGLIAMIHRDFKRLSDLMERVHQQDADPTLPRVDRIVLYIDDLDRCYPPYKVVKVLEAVHLLLFFPLFVVVVGVDSRWLSRSLHKHYQGMLADEAVANQGSGSIERAPAESQDFLEKIFQVPFWLRRMEPVAVRRLIRKLISSEEREASPLPTTPAFAGREVSPLPTAPTSVGAESADEPGAEEAEDDRKASTDTAGTKPEDAARAVAKQITAEAESEKPKGELLAAAAEGLTITEAELMFMEKVAPLMPRTPRSVKRFVNIYRLYKAALTPPALGRFLGTPAMPGNFRAVQVLLALVTGTPRLAQAVFSELLRHEGGSSRRLSDLAKIGTNEEAWRTTLDALQEFANGDCDLSLDSLGEVSPLVARYSVHHMVSAEPGETGLG